MVRFFGTVRSKGTIHILLLKSSLFVLQGLSHASVSMERMSDVIASALNINCSALMGANLAHEVADEQFCETTIGKFYVLSSKIVACLPIVKKWF